MLNEPQLVFTSSVVVRSLLGAVGMVAGAGLVGLAAAPKIASRILPRPKESRLGDFLPFQRMLSDGRTVQCKGNILCQFVGVPGVDQTFIEEGAAQAYANSRKSMYDKISETGVTLRIFTFRDPILLNTTASYPTPLAGEIASAWNRQFSKAYRTRTIICISRKGTSQQDGERLSEARAILESMLSEFGATTLSQDPESSPWSDTTIGSFLGRMISPISQPHPNGTGDDLADALAGDEVHFLRNGRIRFRCGTRERYAVAIGIKKLGDYVSSIMANKLSSLPHETIIFQSIQTLSKAKSLVVLKQNQLMMNASSFGAGNVASQFQDVIELVEGLGENRSTVANFHETIFLFGDTEEELTLAEQACRQILNEADITAVTEQGITQGAWFHQFPGFETRPRSYRLVSDNLAMLATFDSPPAGRDRSAWGRGPISLFHTGSNTIYAHQFHDTISPGAVGHGLCIAPTGKGKTVLMEFLSCMASRHPNLRHFFFDRLQGTYIYTTSMGGKYLSLNSESLSQSTLGGMNPFQCEDTQGNRTFLKLWLRGLTNLPDDDDDATNQTAEAVDMAFETLEPHERSLAAIFDGAFTPNSATRRQLNKWVDPRQYGTLFNAKEDSIDLNKNWLTSFDMTSLFDDPLLAGASVSYIMHRIRQTLMRNGAPGFIFIDETEPMLRDPQFRKIYFVMLQEFRKIGGVVISVFQRPEALKAMGISELVRQNASTYYFFQNPAANQRDYEEFELNEREMGFVLGQTKPARATNRAILVKRPQTRESVILDIDLSGLGPLVRLFSSQATDVKLVSDIQRQFGEGWVKHYLASEAP